jgi:mono/diheme cytochrome c family protein
MTTLALVAALSTGNKIGLAVVGGAFIAFALVSSFVLPARNPSFPGRHVGWFVAAGILFLVAMLSAVLVFGREKAGGAEPAANQQPTTAATAPGTTPATTTSAGNGGGNGGGSGSGGGGGGGGGAQGNAANGKALFAQQGCGGCHTLKAAASSGNVGPNLDQLKPDFQAVVHQVENGGGAMPSFRGSMSEQQIRDVASFVVASTS